MIGVSKHLCGAATDLALRSLASFSSSEKAAATAGESPKSCNIQIVLIALCCHHRCDWSIFVGQDYLKQHEFKPEEFSLLCGLSSWATCGTGKPRKQKDFEKKDKAEAQNVHLDRYDRLDLSRDKREEIGRRVKRILDMARCEFVKSSLKMPKVKLAYYVESGYTLENVVLLAETEIDNS